MSSPDTEIVVVGAARTPFGRFGGRLRDWRLAPLAAASICAALADAGVEFEAVGELALGVNFPGSDRSVARQAVLHAGLPIDVTSYTIDRACCSSMAALSFAARAVRSGTVGVAVAGGTENMSKVPYFLEDMRWGHRLGEVRLIDQLIIACPYTGVPRAVQAADEALSFGIDRTQQDEWAVRSQELWAEATARGYFSQEIVAIPGGGGDDAIEHDECPRPDTTAEDLARLPLVNGSSTVTAGNSPGMATGSTALVVTTASEARRRGCSPLARLLAVEGVSGAPERIASIPAVAARRALAAANVDLNDITLIEVNEAFAAVPLVTTEILSGGDTAERERLRAITNVNGGAIAVGHPTGATAARLVMTLAHELRRRGGGLGLATICGGIGEAHAAIIEVSTS